MNIQIFGHPKCKGTRAAQRFFSDRRIPFQFVDIHRKNLSRGEFDSVARAVGVAALYDATSPRVRDRGLQYAQPDAQRMTELLLDDPLLYRTPIVRNGPRATVGVDEPTWRGWIEGDKAPR